MAILQVRDIDEGTYDMLKETARRHKRSLSQEVIMILETYLQNPAAAQKNATREFLNLGWEDSRNTAEIVRDIEGSRTNSERFGAGNVLFD